ncbi:(2Fe-2S) ferredoxin domain-containing protein [Kitasatospora sp. NPDC052896]|uniref:(2Fe-2S) ferredoxin domain-containing protein n=1 Tax=Kitasatospora sp. NPDC052896 TaxID=3364061 RepID=UPI0037C9DBBB
MSTGAPDPRTPPTVDIVLCRGCCCGNAAKRPDVDHEAQLAALSATADSLAHVRLRTTDCLGPCEQANVVVVRSHARQPDGRRSRPLWLGGLTSADDTAALCEWLRQPAAEADPATPQALPPGLQALRIPARGPDIAARGSSRGGGE